MTPNQRPIVPTCETCGWKDNVSLHYDITSNGRRQYFWWCTWCQRRALKQSQNIKHEKVNQWQRTWTPDQVANFESDRLLNNYSSEVQCCVCGEFGAELHHWAPQSLASYFGDDWHDWPTAYLCEKHHRLWHQVVTFYLPGFDQLKNEMLQRYFEVVGP